MAFESVFGKVPAAATHWSCRKEGGGVLEHAAPGAEAAVREFPIAELSVATIRRRWGAGTYRVHYLTVSKSGARKPQGSSRFVTIAKKPKARAVSEAPSAAEGMPAGTDAGMRMFLQFSTMAAQERRFALEQANQTIERDRNFMASMTASLLAASRANTREESSTSGALNQLLERFDQIEARLDGLDGEDDDDDDDATAGPFRAGEPVGEQLKVALLNALTKHGPELAEKIPELLKIAKGLGVDAPATPPNGAPLS